MAKQRAHRAGLSAPKRHTIHTYYLAYPESPDGRRVLFYSSAHPAGYIGEIRVLDRATGKETVLAEDVHVEDAHRAACQQWLSAGRRVAWHEVVGKRWRVVVVDLETGKKTVAAEDRQIGFGQASGDLVPIYGCHWNPGPFRDLEIWDAATGKLRTAVKIAEVEANYGTWLKEEFGGKPTSVFFPVLSPDLKRVFFKMAAGRGGDDFMAKDASHRQGLICYALNAERFTWMRAPVGPPGVASRFTACDRDGQCALRQRYRHPYADLWRAAAPRHASLDQCRRPAHGHRRHGGIARRPAETLDGGRRRSSRRALGQDC